MGQPLNRTQLFVLGSPTLEENLVGLTFSEIQAVYLSLYSANENLKKWLVWQEGWSDWVPLYDFMKDFKNEFRDMPTAPPPLKLAVDNSLFPDLHGNFEDSTRTLVNHTKVMQMEDDEQTQDLIVEETEGDYIVRQHSRLFKRLLVQIELDKQVFKSHSVDVSVGGILLEEPIPDWVVGYVQVKLTKPDTNNSVKLMASVVENQDPQQKLRLTFVPLKSEANEKKFYNWLISDE